MATLNTTTTTNLDNAIPEFWEEKIRRTAARMAFWDKFEGKEGSNMPLITRMDFTKKPGDTLHINIMSELEGAGVTQDSTLAGNEEKMVLGQFDVTVDWLRHAVAFDERGSRRANFDLIVAANPRLARWLARKKDYDMFYQLMTTASPDETFTKDRADATELVSSDTFGTTEIDRLKLALVRKGAIPMSVIMDNKNEIGIYGLVISEIDAYYLREDAAWVQAQRDVAIKGKDNPLLNGAFGMYNGMILFVHNGISGFQGSPLRPEASLYGAHTDSVTTLTVGVNTNKNYTLMFPDSGTLAITGSTGTVEFVTYTGKTNNTFTGVTRGVTYGSQSSTAAAYTGSEFITQNNHMSSQMAFGAEIAVRAWGALPFAISQVEDYGFEKGVGIASIYGQKAIEDVDGNKPNYLINRSYAKNPSNSR